MMFIIVGGILLILGLIFFLLNGLIIRQNRLHLVPRPLPEHVAVLVPARDESKVIRDLLNDLVKQTFPLLPTDIYVIVESKHDPTVSIAQQLGVNLVIRTDLDKSTGKIDRHRKGYALDFAIKKILKTKHYDAYFIFDADNLVEPNYIEKLLENYQRGYQIATGYRKSKNLNDNVISAASSLTFSMINVLGNRRRVQFGANVIFSGTGCFIDGKLIDQWQGWPFHSLTEDYELSLYATLHGLSTIYSESAVFYDEQPTNFRQTITQRTRWIKGYFSARHQYIPKIKKLLKERRFKPRNYGSLRREVIGVRPIIAMLIGAILILFDSIAKTISINASINWIWLAIGLIAAIYLALVLVTVIIIRRERLALRPKIYSQTLLFNPIYLLTYIWCALKALFSKNLGWKKIEHGKK